MRKKVDATNRKIAAKGVKKVRKSVKKSVRKIVKKAFKKKQKIALAKLKIAMEPARMPTM